VEECWRASRPSLTNMEARAAQTRWWARIARSSLSERGSPRAARACKIPTGRLARSFSWARPVWGKPNWRAPWRPSLFDDETHVVRIDMSEYMEKRQRLSRLLGAPPLCRYEEGRPSTEAVRRARPYSVCFFGRNREGHGDVFNVFLQLLRDGRLTDGQGLARSTSRNTVIIMTSNVGRQAPDERSA